MDTKPTIEDLKAALTEPTSVQEVETETVTTEPETTQDDPLKAELERVQSKKSPAEKARDSLYFNAKKALELGIDPTKDDKLKEILGLKDIEEEDKPLTKKDVLEIVSQATAQKTATQLAHEITNDTERELVLYHLENTIKSTGNPNEDLKLARALTNSARTAQILEEQARKPEAKSHSSATSGSGTKVDPEIQLTPEEQAFLNTGLVTKEEILLNRQGKPIPR